MKKNYRQVTKSINEIILSNFYTRLIDRFKVIEIEEGNIYEVRLYKNFIVTEGIGLEEFEYDMREIIKRLEEKTLMKIGNEYFINTINKVNVVDDETLEIILMCEKIRRREEK